MGDGCVAMYVALVVALAVWVGVFVYLWMLERKVHALRGRLERFVVDEGGDGLMSSTGADAGLGMGAAEPVATLERRADEG